MTAYFQTVMIQKINWALAKIAAENLTAFIAADFSGGGDLLTHLLVQFRDHHVSILILHIIIASLDGDRRTFRITHSHDVHVDALLGGGFGGSIDNCTASGTVKATGNEPVGLGGIGGCLEMMDTITNCTADVTIESENGGHAIGGLCGYAGTHSNPDVCLETEGFSTKNYPSVIDNCNVTVNIKANGATHVGGLVGTGLYYYGEETVFKITNCSVKGSIDGAVTPGTVAGRAEGSTIESCTADVTIDENAGTEQVGTTTQMYESADQ
mgnify:CR=1 FL=1